MVIYARSEANRKVQTDKPSNQNLKRKQRGMAELETGGQKLRSACDAKQRSGERNSRVLKYRNRKGSMETGGTEGRNEGDERNRSAPRKPTVRGKREEGKRRNRGRVVRC